ncbi:MAG: GNAT family N-acetyltransferase [Flavobacteriales bacterium]|nr:GNAT family N-acetyltransferase [Flavobacteriales bacterium]
MYCRNFKEFKEGAARKSPTNAFVADTNGIGISLHSALTENIRDCWDKLVGDDTIFLHSRYFDALGPLGESLEYRFACYTSGDDIIGIAAFQITKAIGSDLGSNIENNGTLSRLTNKFLRNRKIEFNVLVLGNSFASGEHGFRFKKEIPRDTQIQVLVKTTEIIKVEENKNGKRISATLIKDFYPESFQWADRFSGNGFSEFFVDPNMIMPVKASWNSFEDYLNALTSKYRTKAKAAIRRSKDIEIRELSPEDMTILESDLLRLYEQVYDRADFKLGKLDARCFFNLKQHLEECFSLKGFFLEGKLVGFQSSFVYDDCLDCHFIGIDYKLNHKYAIYSRMLYEYIDMAIQRKVSRISFGRTAMEIKSTVGAFPVDMKIYIRHRAKASNQLLKLIFGYVKPSEFNQRVAFKETELKELPIPHKEESATKAS